MFGATYQITGGDLLVAAAGIASAIAVAWSSERLRRSRGATPWGVPSWAWALITVFLFPISIVVYILALLTSLNSSRRRYQGPQMPPGSWQQPWTGPAQAPPVQPPPQPGPQPGMPSPPPWTPPSPWAGPGAGPMPYPAQSPPVPQPSAGPGTVWPVATTDPNGLPLPPNPGPGWYVDPTERFFLRFWDGTRWTEQVAAGGKQSTDPVHQPAVPPHVDVPAGATTDGRPDPTESPQGFGR